MKLNYCSVSRILAARLCYNDGLSVDKIADEADVSTCTVYAWLKQSRMFRTLENIKRRRYL